MLKCIKFLLNNIFTIFKLQTLEQYIFLYDFLMIFLLILRIFLNK